MGYRFLAMAVGLCVASVASAGGLQADHSTRLKPSEMDSITAGGFAGAGAIATASGSRLALTKTNTQTISKKNLVSVAVGHATAVAIGGDSSYASGVGADTGVNGPTLYDGSSGISVHTPVSSTTVGWSVTVGTP